MKIILWKMGSLDHKIFPTTNAIEKLKNMLNRLSPDEVNHLIWGPDIDVSVVDVEDVDQYILAYQKENPA